MVYAEDRAIDVPTDPSQKITTKRLPSAERPLTTTTIEIEEQRASTSGLNSQSARPPSLNKSTRVGRTPNRLSPSPNRLKNGNNLKRATKTPEKNRRSQSKKRRSDESDDDIE